MLLALDIGNSRIKWGLFRQLECLATGHFPTRDFADGEVPDYEFELSGPPGVGAGAGRDPVAHADQALAAGDAPELVARDAPELAQAPQPGPLPVLQLPAVQAVALSCVAGATVEARLLAHLQALGLPPRPVWRVRATAQALGVHNGYAEPGRLGSDRWSALVGARARGLGAVVVVMAGTATTVDALDAGGHFLGGYILPGLRLMPKSLYERTAGIRPGEGGWSEFPDRTADAVASGVLAASAGAVAGMVHSLGMRGAGGVRTLVAGGNGPALLPRMRALGLAPDFQRDLVLEGVVRLHADAHPP